MPKRRSFFFWAAVVFIVAAMAGAYGTTRLLGAEGYQRTEAKKGPMFEVGVFTVDLEPEGRSLGRLLRVAVVLEASSAQALRRIEGRSAEVKHAIVSVLRGRGASSLTGQKGMTSLQTEIRDSLNAVIGDGVVTDVYFPEFVMQ
jgi:flagellar FliL protein